MSTQRAIATLLSEIVDGASSNGGFVLNHDDRGLLRSLDQLTAAQASRIPPGGGSSVAAHVDHLRYGIGLLNRWGDGEKNPFADSDYSASWKRTAVTEPEWAALRDGLRRELERWAVVVRQPREMDETESTAMIGSVVHLAYHVGAIRQIDRATRGPSADD